MLPLDVLTWKKYAISLRVWLNFLGIMGVWMPRAALTEVLSYVEGERAAAIGRARAAGRYERLDEADEVDVLLRVMGRRRVELRRRDGARETLSLNRTRFGAIPEPEAPAGGTPPPRRNRPRHCEHHPSVTV
ncbi:MAG: hypothetical protein JWN00_4172 [Actinomycetia bacterium]|nr:hypothetical protein [Actinomycetes bacterium]